MNFSIILAQADLVLPAQCYSCGRPESEYFVDTGIQIEFYGALYWCNECWASHCRDVGFVNASLVEELSRIAQQLKDAGDEVEKENRRLRDIIELLIGSGYSHGSPTNFDDLESVINSVHRDIATGHLEAVAPESQDNSESSGSSNDEGVAELLASPISNEPDFSLSKPGTRGRTK